MDTLSKIHQLDQDLPLYLYEEALEAAHALEVEARDIHARGTFKLDYCVQSLASIRAQAKRIAESRGVSV